METLQTQTTISTIAQLKQEVMATLWQELTQIIQTKSSNFRLISPISSKQLPVPPTKQQLTSSQSSNNSQQVTNNFRSKCAIWTKASRCKCKCSMHKWRHSSNNSTNQITKTAPSIIIGRQCILDVTYHHLTRTWTQHSTTTQTPTKQYNNKNSWHQSTKKIQEKHTTSHTPQLTTHPQCKSIVHTSQLPNKSQPTKLASNLVPENTNQTTHPTWHPIYQPLPTNQHTTNHQPRNWQWTFGRPANAQLPSQHILDPVT